MSHEDAGRLVLSGLPTYLTPSSSSNHICCMIINYSLQGYIRTCLLRLGIFFYSLFTFILEVDPDVCPLSLNTIFTPAMNYGLLCTYAIMFMSMINLVHLALLWENINNDTLNTSRCNATTIDLYACRIVCNLKDYHSWCFLAALLRLTQS